MRDSATKPDGGASAVGVIVMLVGAATAFTGKVTVAPSTVIVPPSGPIVLVTGGAPLEDEAVELDEQLASASVRTEMAIAATLFMRFSSRLRVAVPRRTNEPVCRRVRQIQYRHEVQE